MNKEHKKVSFHIFCKFSRIVLVLNSVVKVCNLIGVYDRKWLTINFYLARRSLEGHWIWTIKICVNEIARNKKHIWVDKVFEVKNKRAVKILNIYLRSKDQFKKGEKKWYFFKKISHIYWLKFSTALSTSVVG